jgi:hypothetical protein
MQTAPIDGKLYRHARAAVAAIQLVDNPAFDGTDGAHPAWWRGNDAGGAEVTQAVQEMLEGKRQGGVFGSPELQAISVRIKSLLETEWQLKGLQK